MEASLLSPFSINALTIGILPGHLFTLFCNDLLRAEASRIRLPQRLIDDTVRETAPDGGVDLLIGEPNIEDQPSSWGEWVPEGVSAWQYKSGKCPPAKELAGGEFQKWKVREAISRGEPYCFLTADSINPAKAGRIEEALREIYRTYGQEPRVRVYGATKLVEWAKQHLGVAVQHLGVPVTGWLPFDQWEQAHDARNEFFPDKQRSDLIEGVRESVQQRRSMIRILGRPGFGKTRAVMESIREEGLRQRVLYLPDAADLSGNFIWHLRQDAPNAAAILVIDECTAAEYERVSNLARGLPDSVTVVLIGPQEGRERADFVLGELPRGEMAKIVADFAPGLNEAQQDTIAARCGGSPKLVVFVAQEISKGGGAISGWEEIERAQNVAAFLNRLFPVRQSSNPSAKVMRAVSLMTRLGWRGEVEHEGRTVTGVFGLDWTEAKLAAQDLIRLGVVSRRGRYLYPTPDILANLLTRETIESLGTQHLNELFASLPENAKHALAERLRQLGDDPVTRESIAQILDDLDFLGRPSDPSDVSQFYLLRLLAPSLPNTALGVLERFLEPASRDELLTLDASVRREMVRMLEELAWWREHFVRAARLLLRLARAETEDYANNATGVWAQLFQVMLGGTEAPFRERLELLRGVLADPDPGFRKLGLVGLSSSLQTRHMSRIGGPPDDTSRLPPDDWQPATYGEWGDILKDCLAELAKALDDPEPSIRSEAISILADQGSDLIGAGLLKDWAYLVGRLTSEPFEMRKRLFDVVDDALKYSDRLSDEERASLEQLAIDIGGTSFSDRLRRVVGSWDYLRQIDPKQEREPDPVAELADHALRHPDRLEDELEWLFGGDAQAAVPFGKELGRADTNETLLPRLLDRWSSQPQDDRVLTGYLMGIADRRGEEWLEDKLDAWAQDPARALLVAITTWRAIATPRAADRLRRLFRQGNVPPEFLNNLVYGFWARDLEPEHVKRLVEATSDSNAELAVRARLHFLEQFLGERPEGMPLMREAAEAVLCEMPRYRFQTMDGHSWQRLAELVYDGRPMDLSRLAVNAALRHESRVSSLHDEAKNLLHAAISSADSEERRKIFLKVVGPALEKHPATLWSLDDVFNPYLLSLFDIDTFVGWLEEDIDKRLPAVARSIPVHGQPLGDPARTILVRHGNREEVRQLLGSNYITGGWSGSESVYIERKLHQLRSWTEDPDPNVRTWAHEQLEYFEGRLQRTRLLEEEGPY